MSETRDAQCSAAGEAQRPNGLQCRVLRWEETNKDTCKREELMGEKRTRPRNDLTTCRPDPQVASPHLFTGRAGIASISSIQMTRGSLTVASWNS